MVERRYASPLGNGIVALKLSLRYDQGGSSEAKGTFIPVATLPLF